jgi:hypothetical protein
VTRSELAPRGEVAQPVFADYWLHNKGPAPMGYQPVAVQIGPSILKGAGPFRVPLTVASERTDGPMAGTVTLIVPDGWRSEPDSRPYRLAPGAHLALDVTVTPSRDAAPGRYFVAARTEEEGGQLHEDVVTIDYRPGERTPDASVAGRSAILTRAIDRAIAPAAGRVVDDTEAAVGPQPGGELEVEIASGPVTVAAGERGEITVLLRNVAAGEIRGEAQLISPHETWSSITPWTQGFAVAPGATRSISFAVAPPFDSTGGRYWALVKVMYFGRMIYTESVEVILAARSPGGEKQMDVSLPAEAAPARAR